MPEADVNMLKVPVNVCTLGVYLNGHRYSAIFDVKFCAVTLQPSADYLGAVRCSQNMHVGCQHRLPLLMQSQLCRRHRDITGNAPSYLHSLILHLPISIREPSFGGLLHHFAGSTGKILSLLLPQLHNKATQLQNYQSEMEAYETCVGVNGERTILITALKAIS